MKAKNLFEKDEMKEFEAEAKIGLLATKNNEGLPHITLITSIQAKTPEQLVFGQFTEGKSKNNLALNPNAFFLIMSMSLGLWRGKAKWTHLKKEGEDYEMFNNKPMFRYNTYFGFHTVHYMDLIETYGKEILPFISLIPSIVLTWLAKDSVKTNSKNRVLKPWAEELFNKLTSLKFISFIGEDGYPVIIPLFQCMAANNARLVFSPIAYSDELSIIKKGTPVAVLGLTLEMESVLIRGEFTGYDSYRFINLGVIDINWVYNSMPPVPGQIYPIEKLKPVTSF
ncbi:MAG: pyridoxamine 5'-phosphate oxidase family protein [Desulfobacterales bacterium]|nr:pyridoxamine 5'-phosphate oxidase family protein [Desulfobacterales bacterium]